MTLIQAVVLGLVEGATEYLPVSSTGHLLLAQRFMGIGEPQVSGHRKSTAKTAADAYAICIQAGAILAVLGLYAARVKQMVLGLMGKDPSGFRMVVNIFAGFAPAAVCGLMLADRIQAVLFGPWPVIAAWFAGGVAILAVAWWTKGRRRLSSDSMALDELTWKMALGIGVAQCVAMWPGVSRSLMTIVGGVLVGLSVPAAVEFSFLLGVVTLGAATGYEALKHGEIMLAMFDPLVLLAGLMVAFVSAAIAVKWMVAYLNRHGLALFGYYRVALAAGAALLMTMNVV
ncbi:MAG: undecaprenyl-diphosphate phosphatase [Deltaproteobacteria bacterium]|nr:undecaprenyl-diphosphate phosphatase [Deltaproteobacteria bacterium]